MEDQLFDFYQNRIENFGEERKFVSEYTSLLSKNEEELNSYEWGDKKDHEDLVMIKAELSSLDSMVEKANEERAALNMKFEQKVLERTLRLRKLSQLALLPQPVEYSKTFVIQDKFPPPPPPRSTEYFVPEDEDDETLIENVESLGAKFRRVRDGDLILLEGKLKKKTSEIKEKLSEAAGAGEEVRRFGKFVSTNSPEMDELRSLLTLSEEGVEDVESLLSQLSLSVQQLLSTRLQIYKDQREELETNYSLEHTKHTSKKQQDQFQLQHQQETDFIYTHYKSQFSLLTKEYQFQMKKLNEKLLFLEKDEEKMTCLLFKSENNNNEEEEKVEGKLLKKSTTIYDSCGVCREKEKNKVFQNQSSKITTTTIPRKLMVPKKKDQKLIINKNNNNNNNNSNQHQSHPPPQHHPHPHHHHHSHPSMTPHHTSTSSSSSSLSPSALISSLSPPCPPSLALELTQPSPPLPLPTPPSPSFSSPSPPSDFSSSSSPPFPSPTIIQKNSKKKLKSVKKNKSNSNSFPLTSSSSSSSSTDFSLYTPQYFEKLEKEVQDLATKYHKLSVRFNLEREGYFTELRMMKEKWDDTKQLIH